MIFKEPGTWKIVTAPLFVLLTGILAACGSVSATANTSSVSGTPTTTTACLSLATGTIQSVSGTTLQINDMQGKSVQATLTSKTTISQQKTLNASDIKAGSPVSVTVKQNADNTYSALTITVRGSQAVQGGFGRGGGARGTGGAKLCNAQGRPRANGTPGAFGGPGGAFGQGRQTISGTVTQLKDTSLTLTDASSNDYTVGLTSATRIATQQIITPGDLHSGEAVTIIGTVSGNGGISASSVSVLQGLPIRRVQPTSTPTAISGA